MSYVNTSTAARSGFSDRMGAIVKLAGEALRKRRLYSQTYRELAGLTDRELSDLGINRVLIREIALEAAYGK